MKLPVDKDLFSEFIEKSDIFGLTQKYMYEYLKNWYSDDKTRFIENMRADLDTVLSKYHFYEEKVSFDKNFNFEPPADTITCIICITHEDDDICIDYRYKAIFDYGLNIIDDYMF